MPYWILDIGYWRKILPAKIQELLVNPIPLFHEIQIQHIVRMIILKNCISPCFSIDYHLGFTHFPGFIIVITRDKRILTQVLVFGCARDINKLSPQFSARNTKHDHLNIRI